MRPTVKSALIALLCLGTPLTAMAQSKMLETFETAPETRWRFFTDTVMGGVSQGELDFLREGGQTHARLTGTVSTENNGGFIQMRTDLSAPPPDDATGLRLVLRGNDQRYFVHLRTGGTVLPWQYYQAGFHAPPEWTEIRLPFTAFEPSGRLLRGTPRIAGIKSVGIVAFGRDHEAEIDLREVGFY
ncbi:CIA30 family protein [Aquicoccus sp.]|uniref:CIA30 family protein n=1 Tax=Aquicoccus sp. TaxID=2055851 RepID=UPI00356663DF